VIALAAVWPTFAQLATSTHLVAQGLEWPTVVAGSVINPVFEEVFVCAYVVTALKDRVGVTTAVNVSAGIRVFYHFYQGAVGVVGIAPMALLFAYWFARTRWRGGALSRHRLVACARFAQRPPRQNSGFTSALSGLDCVTRAYGNKSGC
jgi:hypothetical protein